VEGQKVAYTKRDLAVGLWPYNLDITPDGKLALTADNGNAGGSDGNVDTVSVIDMEAIPPRVSNNAKTDWFYNRNGSVAVLRIDGKKVTKVGEVEVRGLPEGAVFSPDGKWLYIGNFMDSDISVLRVDGDTVTNTGTLLKLPGKPASMRGRTQ
jgi:DNA-binding beta-propeller fold protein YncE